MIHASRMRMIHASRTRMVLRVMSMEAVVSPITQRQLHLHAARPTKIQLLHQQEPLLPLQNK